MSEPTQKQVKTELKVVSWNLAAINNNPFEYWIHYEDPCYDRLMREIERIIDDPSGDDKPVGDIFSEEMFLELKELMQAQSWVGVEETEKLWQTDFKQRAIIAQFLKDKSIGSKRLISMGDRMTNTTNTIDKDTYYRPTVINGGSVSMATTAEWWSAWKRFMFVDTIKISSKKGEIETKPCDMLVPIQRKKYPAVTEEEERISVPLQTMCMAIFDCILLHLVSTIEPNWQEMKLSMVDKLIRSKIPNQCELLHKLHNDDADIICMQEAAGLFLSALTNSDLSKTFHILSPEKMCAKRDQNSIILVRKDRFDNTGVIELTNLVSDEMKDGGLADGDLFVVSLKDFEQNKFYLTSFHGDTNGLMTVPVLNAVHKLWTERYSDHNLVMGLDANTYLKGDDVKNQTVQGFAKAFISKGMTSGWGDTPDNTHLTTFNCRTFLQPQLNKAIRFGERAEKGDVNPKDHILFMRSQFSCSHASKDNTGKREYVEGMVFPTLAFPSDHAIITATLTPAAS